MSSVQTGTISDVYGQLVSAAQIEDAVADTLRKWFPSYLAEVERQLNLPKSTLPAPRNYLNRDNFIAQKGEEIPKVVVIAQGLGQQPTVYQHRYSAAWQIGVGIATAATPEFKANRDVKAYAAAIRGIMLQNQSLGLVSYTDDELDDYGKPIYSGVPIEVVRVTWVNENYNDVLTDNQIALFKSASVHFVVEVDNVTKKWGGPDAPDLLPPNEHIVETVITDVQLLD